MQKAANDMCRCLGRVYPMGRRRPNRGEGFWLTILHIPKLKKNTVLFLAILWVILLLHCVGWHKDSWKIQNVLIHQAGSWFLLLAGNSVAWDFTWLLECPHTVGLGSKMVHSKHKGESCKYFMAEPWRLHSVMSATFYWSKELQGQPRSEGRGSNHHLSMGRWAKNVRPCLFSVHKRFTVLLHTKRHHLPRPPPPKFYATMASNSGLKSMILSLKSGPWCCETLTILRALLSSWEDLRGTALYLLKS